MPVDTSLSTIVTKQNFKDICRSCLQSLGKINIFKIKLEQLFLSELIHNCFGEEIPFIEEYPDKLCTECLKYILYSVVFVRRLKGNQRYIQRLDNIFREGPDYFKEVDEIIEEITANALLINEILEGEDIMQSLHRTETVLRIFTNLSNGNNNIHEPQIEINEVIKCEDECIETPDIPVISIKEDDLIHQTNISEGINETLDKSIHTSENLSNGTCDVKEPFEIITILGVETVDSKAQKAELATKKKVETNTWQCFDCLETFETLKSLMEHTKNIGHTMLPRFQCEICSRFFKTAKAFRTHSARHTKRVKSVCDVCGASVLPRNLKRHLLSHEEKGNVCQYCGKTFVQKGTMALHVRNKHEGKKRVGLCCICGKVCANTTLLTAHLNTHSMEELKDVAYGCEQCGRFFVSEDSLHVHVQRLHVDPIEPKKSDNVKQNSSSRPAKNYKKYAYKPKICPICSKSISYLGYAAHLRVHDGTKPFACKVCQQTFKQKAHLRTHMTIHLDLKPYGCRFCQKKFRHASSLKTHERAHRGEKPFKCPVCNKRFYESSPMKKHMKIHSKNKLEAENSNSEYDAQI